MSTKNVAVLCIVSAALAAAVVLSVPSATDGASKNSGASPKQGDVAPRLRAQIRRERHAAVRAVGIRTRQVRHLRTHVRSLAHTLVYSPASPVSHLIEVEATVRGLNADTMKRVAYRESSLGRGGPETGPGSSATAVNPTSLAGEPRGACGVFQYIPSTYSKTAVAQAGYPCTDWMAEVVQTADWWARGMASNWSPLPGPVMR